MRAAVLFVIGISPPLSASQIQDSARVYREARNAEAQYEYVARHSAPLGGGSRPRGSCDEIVGRFCLYHDSGRDPLPPEPPEIAVVRLKAIDKLRTAFELNPARVATVLPLVRLLMENKDVAGTLAVTQAFQAADGDIVTGHMLAVLSHHAAGNIPEAESAIARWLAMLDSTKRRGLEDLTWLLDRRERSRYRALSDEQKVAYQERFWRYADALYLTPGNEIRTEHFARHVENHLLRTVPVVRGSTSWGDDVAQLTIRYGIPKARTRLWPGSSVTSELQINEHYDPEQMIYAPSAIDSVLKVTARPAGGWPMDTVRSISGHDPSTVRRMLPLEHQAGLYRESGTLLLRVDGRIIADDSASGKTRTHRALVVLDADLRELARVEDWGPLRGDTLYLRMEIPLPAGAAHYSAELLEPETRLAARARFPIAPHSSDSALYLSDIMIAEPFPPGRMPASRSDPSVTPKAALLIAPDSSFGVYAQVDLHRAGRRTVNVELELTGIDGSPALVRAARWLGRTLGLGQRPRPNKLSWTVEIPESGRTAIAVTIDPGRLKRGRYLVNLAVSDQAARRAQARREILID